MRDLTGFSEINNGFNEINAFCKKLGHYSVNMQSTGIQNLLKSLSWHGLTSSDHGSYEYETEVPSRSRNGILFRNCQLAHGRLTRSEAHLAMTSTRFSGVGLNTNHERKGSPHLKQKDRSAPLGLSFSFFSPEYEV